MTSCGFNIFIILTVYLNFISHRSHGFKVIQPQFKTVNPDGSVTISCEHNEDIPSVTDVRLYSIGPERTPHSMLCQKGKTNCENITMYQENPKKWLFILLNIGPNAMNYMYQCEITLTKGIVDYSGNGMPTKLLAGKQKTEDCVTFHPPPSPPPPPQYHLLSWILIGLVILVIVYSCVITSMYISLWVTSNREQESCTYVEMRKAPLTANPPPSIYCG